MTFQVTLAILLCIYFTPVSSNQSSRCQTVERLLPSSPDPHWRLLFTLAIVMPGYSFSNAPISFLSTLGSRLTNRHANRLRWRPANLPRAPQVSVISVTLYIASGAAVSPRPIQYFFLALSWVCGCLLFDLMPLRVQIMSISVFITPTTLSFNRLHLGRHRWHAEAVEIPPAAGLVSSRLNSINSQPFLYNQLSANDSHCFALWIQWINDLGFGFHRLSIALIPN